VINIHARDDVYVLNNLFEQSKYGEKLLKKKLKKQAKNTTA